VQKIERELPKPIESEEQQVKAQRTIVQQHAEVISLIEKRANARKQPTAVAPEAPSKIDRRIVPDNPADYAEPLVPVMEPEPEAAPPVDVPPAEDRRDFYEQIPEGLMNLPGVRQVFRLTNDGEFVDTVAQAQFKKGYKKIFKNLADLMELYSREGGGIKRKVGVYEVQPDRLYFASSGIECYFIVVDDPSIDFNYEVGIGDILAGR
jgi:hypothetical protein